VPKGTAGASLERKGIVRRGDKHDVVHDDWPDLEFVGVARVKDPFSAKIGYIVGSDL
jgi:hypothetical protein